MSLTSELNKFLFGFLPQYQPFKFVVEEEESTVTFNFVTGNLSLINDEMFPYIFAISQNFDAVFLMENNKKTYMFSCLNKEYSAKYIENNMPISASEHIKIASSIIHLIDYGYLFTIDDSPNKKLEELLYKVLENE